jgi:hypothetical protein
MPRHSAPRLPSEIALATVIGLLIAAVPIMFRTDDSPVSPSQPPRTGVTAYVKSLRTVPGVGDDRRRVLAKGIAHDLDVLYTRAFVVEEQRPGPTPATPTPRPPAPSKKVSSLLTGRARAALKQSPGIFDELRGLTIREARLSFQGVVTLDGAKALEALLDVTIVGTATPVGANGPVLKLKQAGTISLRRSPNQWLVDGFDLRLRTRPMPSPAPVQR